MRRVPRLSTKRQLWRMRSLSQREKSSDLQGSTMRQTYGEKGRRLFFIFIIINPPHWNQ